MGYLIQMVGMFAELTANQESAMQSEVQSRENTALANTAAADAVARGNREAGIIRSKGTQLAGQQKMAYVAGGVDPTVGSAAQVASDSRYYAELDAQTAENNAAREAWGYRRYGLQFQTQAGINASKAANQQTATILGGVGSLANSRQWTESDFDMGGGGGEKWYEDGGEGYQQSELDSVWGE